MDGPEGRVGPDSSGRNVRLEAHAQAVVTRAVLTGDLDTEPPRAGVEGEPDAHEEAIVVIAEPPALLDRGAQRTMVHQSRGEQVRRELVLAHGGGVKVTPVAPALPVHEIANHATGLRERQ